MKENKYLFRDTCGGYTQYLGEGRMGARRKIEYNVRVRMKRGEETENKASMISNVSLIRSEAEVHYESPPRLYL